jgi:hypothetical protein
MYTTIQKNLIPILLLFTLLIACKKEGSRDASPATLSSETVSTAGKTITGTVTPFSSGFNDPRGLKFGPDGYLYVAEAGIGGTTSSATFSCMQAPPPFGPYFGSTTGGRISKVSPAGVRTTVTTQLPTSLSGIGDIMGPADVAFIGNTLYVLVNAGCSKGVPSMPAGVYRINANGSPTLVADLSAWQAAHPVAVPEPGDFEPDGAWYSMVAVGNDLYALEPNHGELVKVQLNGTVSRVVDFSATMGHMVPTGLDYNGNFYVGNLGTFPITGQSMLMKVSPNGSVHTLATGLSAIVSVVVSKPWTYVLELTAGSPFPQPGAGRVSAIAANGVSQVIAGGLNLPTGMTMGADGNLYVSQWGFGMPPGGGQLVKITLH